MHFLTRVALTVGCLLVLVTALRAAITAPRPAAPDAVGTAPAASGLEPRSAQRRGEWSPVCAKTTQPLIDFSPIDRGTGMNTMLVTVHNCSAQPVRLGGPSLELPGSQSGPLRTDAERTRVVPLSLAPWESAQLIVRWEGNQHVDPAERSRLAVRVPDIGEGELTDVLDIGPTTRLWLSGWTPA